MDRAGWHIAKDLAVPANLTPLLARAERDRAGLALRGRFLAPRLWPSCDDILDACCAAWNTRLAAAGRIQSLCALDGATVSS